MLRTFNHHEFICLYIYSTTCKSLICFSLAASYSCSSSWTPSWISSPCPAPSSLWKVPEGRALLRCFLWLWRKRRCHSESPCHRCCVKERRRRRRGRDLDVMRLLSRLLWRSCRGAERCGSWMWRGAGWDWAPWWMPAGIVAWPAACVTLSSVQIWPLFWTLRELCPANILHTLYVENPIIKGVCSRDPFNTAVYMPPGLRAPHVRSLSDSLLGLMSDCGQPQSGSTGSPPGSHSLNLITKCVFLSFCPFSLFSMCCCGLLFSRGRRPL